MNWKIARDRYLAPLCRKHGEAAAFAAGFFEDEDPEPAPLDDVDWLCTPRPKRDATGERPVVLLATGGFCPVHAGHLEMMERARTAVERAGYSVVGGYLSPGHDAYLRAKCGPLSSPAQERLRQCAVAVADSDWLSVDPWESMHRRVAVNYTDVTARLRAYLRAHVDARIEVLYVCGGDNARFAYAFTERGRCVVVNRSGAEAEFERWRATLAGHPNVIWVEGSGRLASSSALRTSPPAPSQRARLVVRLEDQRAVRTLQLSSLREFQQQLLALLARYATVRLAPLEACPLAPHVISLDPLLPGRHNLALSRLFAPGGYEALGHVARPGAAPLAEQAALIPPGNYVLRDDDSITGGTIAAVRAVLSSNVTISAVDVALTHADDEDVVDARDFLLGSDDGGLVLQLPGGGVGRAPYVLPYVDPFARASIAASREFSIAVWALNAHVFEPTELRVRDLPQATRATLPLPDTMKLNDVCAWHIERLRRGAPLERPDDRDLTAS
jgi:nicotinic acid mononucleotide adenylyltransferase